MAPGLAEANSKSFSSVMGRASISALMSMVRPGLSPTSRANTLFSVGREISRSSKVSSVSRTNRVVSSSGKETSGFRWRWRLHATTCSLVSATRASSVAASISAPCLGLSSAR
jgi:hypothetical protein